MDDQVSALLAAYAWADSADRLAEAISITLAHPDDGRVPDRLSVRRELPERLTVSGGLVAIDALPDFAWGAVIAQIDSRDGWAVVIEPNGWALADEEALRALSVGGVAVNVFWNVNAVMSFSLARDGVLVRTFDGLIYDARDEPIPEETGFTWGVAAPRASMLGVMERLTGVRLSRDWVLSTPRRTFEVVLPQP
jgi:hypothetical protein